MMTIEQQQSLITLTDRQLVRWATRFGGWQYIHSNDQLRDPQGGMTTAHNWVSIGSPRRAEIMAQMKGCATQEQLAAITLE